MAIEILICDDNRMTVAAYTRALSPIEGVKIIEIDHPVHLMDKLRTHPDVGVLLMDLEFPVSPGSDTKEVMGHKYLPEVRHKYPGVKVVVMTRLGPSVYEVIQECGRLRLHDEWIDVGKAFKDEEIRARVEGVIFPLGVVSRGGAWILHVSDLHFGNSVRFDYWGLAEDGALSDAILEDVGQTLPGEFEEFPGRVDLVAATGDISDKGRDWEFSKAVEFLTDVMRECVDVRFNLDGDQRMRRLLMIPGNHDVNWDISRARSLEYDQLKKKWQVRNLSKGDDVPEDLRYLARYSWAPFDQFWQRLGLQEPTCADIWNLENSFGGTAWSLPELGMMVYGLNTAAEKVNHFENVPAVDPKVTKLLESFSKSHKVTAGALPTVALVHHSLGSTGSGTERPNDNVIGALREALCDRLGATVFLTGHVHKQVCEPITVRNKALLFIGAGTVGRVEARGAQTEPLQYNVINIMPEMPAAGRGPRVTVYPRILHQARFVKHPVSPKLPYEWDRTAGWILRDA